MELIFVAFLALVIVGIICGARAAAKRKKELQEWAARRGFRFSEERDGGLDARHPGFECLQRGSGRYAYNRIDGQWGGRAFLAFDYHYETHSTNAKGHRQTHHHYLSAVIVESPVPLRPLLIRPEGFFDRIAEFVGFDDIDFESAEFSRAFYVTSPDKKWAYDVIHQRTMEFLLSQPRHSIQFDGRHAIAYTGSRFSPREFEDAAGVVEGILDRLPEYLIQEQRDRGAGTGRS